MKPSWFCAALLLCAGCTISQGAKDPGPLADAKVTADFASYRLGRVGLVPTLGQEYGEQTNEDLTFSVQQAFSELRRIEIVRLERQDLELGAPFEGWRRGWYDPHSIVALARAHSLDAILVPTVTDRQVIAPQRLGATLDLISCETGQVLWSATVHLDTATERTRTAFEYWATQSGEDLGTTAWEALLLSPRRLSQLAASHLARAWPRE